jgi:ABC-type Na+ efflux pump permease subunit
VRFGALDDPGSSLARAMSFIPPSAPMVMPVAGAATLIAVAARVYGAAVLRTGARVSLRTVWRAAGERSVGGRR